MKIIIGSDGNRLESPVAKRFGHAAYYIFYDSDTNSFESFANDVEGHNHENLEKFLEMGAQAFIVGNIGPHAFEMINTPRSSVYLARKMSVKEAIDNLLNGKLEMLKEPTAKRSIGHGGKQGHGEGYGYGRHSH
ncbi:NifB/NifX family molybdenum-iron cluster-binding protein [Melioribacter sp. Ez-97]|uniref:NifB/NifX family molybdenum-iron cluster-binding protein n=1 Tax=Melioribacter sp. Ez-97 TaxID=3423434 RepID=UPI003ED9BF09